MVANPADEGRRHEHDPAADAIAGAFALLRASLDDPDVIRDLPDNAVVEFRNVDIRGHLFAMTAARGEDSDIWTARPYRHRRTKPTRVWERPIGESHVAARDQNILVQTIRATGRSGNDALDALTRKLTEAIDRGFPATPSR